MSRKKVPHDDTSHAFLDSIFSNSPEAIVMLDHRNRVIRTNAEFDRLFGYDPAEITGRHIDTLIAWGDEQKEANAYSRMAERGERLNSESVRRRKDGTTVDVSIMGAPVERDGKVIGIFGIYRDISERKEMERRLAASEASYRGLFENAPIGIYQSSSKGHYLRVNQFQADILGCRSPEEVIEHYSNLADTLYYRPEERKELIDQLMKYHSLQNYEFQALRKDRSVIWISVSCRISQWLDDGSFIMDGFIIDKTGIKKAEQQIRHSLREKEVLLQEVHHRVKNNMQIISSLLNLELMNSDDEPMRELLYVIQKRIQTMALVHEKLYTSETIALVELGEYTRDLTMQILDIMAGDSTIEVGFELEELYAGIDFSVPFGLIVNELVMNSYKHAFRGIKSPSLRIQLHRSPKALVLSLRDNGVGLPENFDVDEMKTLGMKLIHSLVAQLDGEIRFSSRRGTECVVTFPLERISSGPESLP
ncbi:MAG: sensor histidine kinase [Sediminispirochaetaceae bacterium]